MGLFKKTQYSSVKVNKKVVERTSSVDHIFIDAAGLTPSQITFAHSRELKGRNPKDVPVVITGIHPLNCPDITSILGICHKRKI